MKPWILGSCVKDLSFFYVGAALTLLCAPLFPKSAMLSMLAVFVISAVIDTGHGYLTIWRLRWRSREDQIKGVFVFLCVFAGVVLWILLGLRGFWSAFIYFTYFHYVRQFYGISRWYQKKNGVFRKTSDYFLTVIYLLPAIAYHFRDLGLSIYGLGELFFYPNALCFLSLKIAWFTSFIIWILYELRLRKVLGYFEWNRISSIAFPGLMGAYCFFWGTTTFEIFSPLVVAHGVSYWAVTSLSMPVESKTISYGRAQILGLGTLLLAGIWATGVESLLDSYDYLSPMGHGINSAVLIALLVTPAIWHYLLDGVLWKSRDPEAKKIFNFQF